MRLTPEEIAVVRDTTHSIYVCLGLDTPVNDCPLPAPFAPLRS